MWKKDEQTDSTPESTREAAQRPPSRGDSGKGNGIATIGRSIRIKGDVTGDEDLLIQGHVDGSVKLEQHAVTVGANGRVHASISARIVTVEGEVEGNLTAEERVVLRSSARVQGDIEAPRVVLEDGASFRGGIDMGEPAPARGSGSRGTSKGTGTANTPTASGPTSTSGPDRSDDADSGSGKKAKKSEAGAGPSR